MLTSDVFGFGILHIANLELLLFYISDVINKNTSSYAHLVLDNGFIHENIINHINHVFNFYLFQFLNEHAGSSNAFTSLECTNYFFDVALDHLAGALDR